MNADDRGAAEDAVWVNGNDARLFGNLEHVAWKPRVPRYDSGHLTQPTRRDALVMETPLAHDGNQETGGQRRDASWYAEQRPDKQERQRPYPAKRHGGEHDYMIPAHL